MTRTVKIIATFDDLKGAYGSFAQVLEGIEMVVTKEGKGWVRGVVEGRDVILFNDGSGKEYE